MAANSTSASNFIETGVSNCAWHGSHPDFVIDYTEALPSLHCCRCNNNVPVKDRHKNANKPRTGKVTREDLAMIRRAIKELDSR